MGVGTLISLEEYLRSSFHPDRDFVEGQVVERNVGKRRHAFTQGEIAIWFGRQKDMLRLQPMTELRVRVGADRVRIPDVVVCELPLPDEEIFTAPSYLFVEVMSEEDTMSGLQDRIDDYLRFGVPNIWVIDPWKHRGWRVTADGWAVASDGIMRTADERVAMPLADVLLP
jgi:Uma2 family endonuclease